MINITYNIGISLYYALLHIIALFNNKASKWVVGQRQNLHRLKNWRNENASKKLVWFHCASLGEFEEAKAFRNILQSQYDTLIFCFSFFSPSGYENAQLSECDLKFYLPMDFKGRQKSLVNIMNPELMIFVKYEYWFNLLKLLKEFDIKYGYINSTLDGSEYFHKIDTFSNLVKSASFIQMTNTSNKSHLESNGYKNIFIARDLRWLSAENNFNFDYKPNFNFSKIKKPIFILGSIHKEDDKILSTILSFFNDFFIVIAPHEIDELSIRKYKSQVPVDFKLYSSISFQDDAEGLIIDTIGDLKYLYRYAAIAYIGGGLGQGLHNVHEALIYKIPTLFTGKITKLSECKILKHFKNTDELKLIIESLKTKDFNINGLSPNNIVGSEISFVNPTVNTIFEQILK